jgi:hypothetical membrane protein
MMSNSTTGASTGEGWTLGRLTALAGPAAVVVSFVGVLGSVALASWVVGSWFTWTGHALSDLGHPDRVVAPLFNYSLVVAGLLGVAYAGRVLTAGTNAFHRLGAVMLGLGLLNSALVGVFNLPHPMHGPVALVYFVLLTLGLFAHGSGDALAGRPRRGVLTTWLAVAHVAGWVLLSFVPFDGIALPELVGVVGLWTWTLLTYAELRG